MITHQQVVCTFALPHVPGRCRVSSTGPGACDTPLGVQKTELATCLAGGPVELWAMHSGRTGRMFGRSLHTYIESFQETSDVTLA